MTPEVAHIAMPLLCAGGFNREKIVLNNVLRYEVSVDKWTKVANMSTARARHG